MATRELFTTVALLLSTMGSGFAGPPQAGLPESCYVNTHVMVPKASSVKIAYVDNSTFFPKEFREATSRVARSWPQPGDRILLLHFAVGNGSDMPEVILDRLIEPIIKDRGWLSHAKEQQIDRCLERQRDQIRDEFRSELAKALEMYRADSGGRSPIAAALAETKSLVASIPRGQVSVLVLTDGVEHSGLPPRGVSFYQPGGGQQLRALDPQREVGQLKELGLLPSLPGVKIWMAGVGLPEPAANGQPNYRRPAADIASLKSTWTSIFAAAKANLIEINSGSPLRPLE